MHRFSLLLTLPLLAVAVVFSVVNRHAVTLSFWPFQTELQLPLFVLVLAGLIVGVLIGFLVAWFSAGTLRRRLRYERERVRTLESEIERLKRDHALAQPPAPPPLPAAAPAPLRLAREGARV